MLPKHTLPPDFIRVAITGISVTKMCQRFGVSPSVVRRWLELPEVKEGLGYGPQVRARVEPPAAAAAPVAEPEAPRQPPPAKVVDVKPVDPSDAAVALRNEAAKHAGKIAATYLDVMDDVSVPGARIAAADKLAAYLPPPPAPKETAEPIPTSPVEFYEWRFRRVRAQVDANVSNSAAWIAGSRMLEATFLALNAARANEAKKSGGYKAAIDQIMSICRAQPIGVLDDLIARLVSLREERAPTAQA